jgi:hypothetical protein
MTKDVCLYGGLNSAMISAESLLSEGTVHKLPYFVINFKTSLYIYIHQFFANHSHQVSLCHLISLSLSLCIR